MPVGKSRPAKLPSGARPLPPLGSGCRLYSIVEQAITNKAVESGKSFFCLLSQLVTNSFNPARQSPDTIRQRQHQTRTESETRQRKFFHLFRVNGVNAFRPPVSCNRGFNRASEMNIGDSDSVFPLPVPFLPTGGTSPTRQWQSPFSLFLFFFSLPASNLPQIP